MQAITLVGVCLSAVLTEGNAQTPIWSQGNLPTPDTVALFKFDEGSSESLPATPRTGVPENTMVTHLHNHLALDAGQRMEHYNFNSTDVGTHRLYNDTASAALGNASLALNGNVRFRALQIFEDANLNHLTVEAWLKWNDTVTSSDLRIGTGDRALRIIRDAANPANDAIGFQGSHGVWRPSAAFNGFANLPVPVIDGTWFHVAMVVFNAECMIMPATGTMKMARLR
jgi:hypothetical protein